MNRTELNRYIPYWEDDPEELPEGIPPVTRPDVPVAGYNGGLSDKYFLDEIGQWEFPRCFAERL